MSLGKVARRLGRGVRAAIAVSVAAACLAGGAWASGEGAARALDSGDPRAAKLTRVGDSLEAAGRRMQLWVGQSGDAPQAVVAWYAARLRERGLSPFGGGDHRMAHVSAFDRAAAVQRSVCALEQPDGSTLILVSSSELSSPPRFDLDPRALPFPVPADARAFLSFTSEDGGARSLGGQFETARDPSSLFDFFRSTLAARGFHEQPGGAGAAAGLLVLTGPGARFTVAAQALNSSGGAVALVEWVEGAR